MYLYLISLRPAHKRLNRYSYKNSYFAPILTLFLINHRQISDGITITVVIIKNVPQSPFNQSTSAPDEEARVVLPAVPIDANNAY